MKKVLTVILAMCLSLSIVGCSKKEEKKNYIIGVSQLVYNKELNEATRGFQETLLEELGKENVKFDVRIGKGKKEEYETFAKDFVDIPADLIFTNGATCLQAAAKTTTDIPILATSLTNYPKALEMEVWNGCSQRNVSGTIDMASFEQQAIQMETLFPSKQYKKVGLLYSDSANSLYQVNEMKKELETFDYACELTSGENLDKYDLLYVPTDSNLSSILEILKEIEKPIYTADEDFCKECGVATISISYYDLGVLTAQMAYKVLVEGEDVSTMEIQFSPKLIKKFNKKNSKKFGVKIPDSYIELDDKKAKD